MEDFLESVSDLRHAVQRDIMHDTLTSFIQDISRRGRHSDVYRGFYRYFTDYDFRSLHGLPLP